MQLMPNNDFYCVVVILTAGLRLSQNMISVAALPDFEVKKNYVMTIQT